MHKTSPVDCYIDFCLSDDTTLLIIGNDVRTINTTACVVSLVIGERLSNETKHVRCFYQDVLIIGTVQQDLVVITDVFLGSAQLHRIFLAWGAALFNCTPIVLQIIYVLLHDLVRNETAATDNGKSYSIRTVNQEDGDMSSADVYDDTARGAVDKSLLLVSNTAAASATMVCTSSLLQRLPRLLAELHLFAMFSDGSNNNSFNSETSLQQLSCLRCLYTVLTMQYFINSELTRCLKMKKKRLPVHMRRFYSHMKYQCDISYGPSLVFHNFADR